MKILAIIPARGGSKGVPGKNSHFIEGKPLIRYSIDAAIKANCFADIYVSSDDDDILLLSEMQGVVCLKRPPELATDKASIIPVINNVLEIAEKKAGDLYDVIMLLQPTAPIRETYHITDAIEIFKKSNASALISVCEMTDIHPARMYKIKENLLESFIPEFEQARRQDIPPAYYRNGSIYLVKRDAFIEQGVIMAKPSVPFVMESKYLCNIDEPRDLIIAEALIKAWNNGRL